MASQGHYDTVKDLLMRLWWVREHPERYLDDARLHVNLQAVEKEAESFGESTGEEIIYAVAKGVWTGYGPVDIIRAAAKLDEENWAAVMRAILQTRPARGIAVGTDA